jgi:hypothetical protein
MRRRKLDSAEGIFHIIGDFLDAQCVILIVVNQLFDRFYGRCKGGVRRQLFQQWLSLY